MTGRTLAPRAAALSAALLAAALLLRGPATLVAQQHGPGGAQAAPHGFLAEFEGRPVGMLAARTSGADTVELETMWAEPLVRRRGAGRRLLDAVSAWASDAGRSALELWVLASNEGARRMYARYGFGLVEGEERAAPPSGSEVRMRLLLRS